MTASETPKTLVGDRTLDVFVRDGAMMTVPRQEWCWQLRYNKLEPERPPTICNDRMIAAGVMESFLYLVLECTREEAWHRIKQMRRSIIKHDRAALSKEPQS
jgi:hypothetical protein